jgi:hypothetical protein
MPKQKERNVHAKRHERKKYMPKSMKKRKEKERNKDNPCFQIKCIHQKKRFMIKGVPKRFRIRTL